MSDNSTPANGVFTDDIFIISNTESLRARFDSIRKRGDLKYAAEGGGLSKKSQYEMYQYCLSVDGDKGSHILELVHYLSVQHGVSVIDDLNPRIKRFGGDVPRYCVHVACVQRRELAEGVAGAALTERTATREPVAF